MNQDDLRLEYVIQQTLSFVAINRPKCSVCKNKPSNGVVAISLSEKDMKIMAVPENRGCTTILAACHDCLVDKDVKEKSIKKIYASSFSDSNEIIDIGDDEQAELRRFWKGESID